MASAAVSVSKYLGFFQRKHLHSVLDYGAGTLRNSRYLAEAGFEVYAADLPAQAERIVKMGGVRSLQEYWRMMTWNKRLCHYYRRNAVAVLYRLPTVGASNEGGAGHHASPS